MGISLSYLTSLYSSFNTGSSGSGDLLATLYGLTGQTTNALGQNPVQALASAELNQTQDVKAVAAQPAVQRAISTFTAAVSSAKTVQ